MFSQVLTLPWLIVLAAVGVFAVVRLRNMLIAAAVVVVAATQFFDLSGLLGNLQ